MMTKDQKMCQQNIMFNLSATHHSPVSPTCRRHVPSPCLQLLNVYARPLIGFHSPPVKSELATVANCGEAGPSPGAADICMHLIMVRGALSTSLPSVTRLSNDNHINSRNTSRSKFSCFLPSQMQNLMCSE